MVLLEVMEHGKAVVSTDVGGVREVIVDGEGGILVAPESPEAVAGALVRLIEDRKLRARMGAYNRQRRRERFGVAPREGEAAARAVTDWLSGMTDRFAIATWEELFVPRPWGMI